MIHPLEMLIIFHWWLAEMTNIKMAKARGYKSTWWAWGRCGHSRGLPEGKMVAQRSYRGWLRRIWFLSWQFSGSPTMREGSSTLVIAPARRHQPPVPSHLASQLQTWPWLLYWNAKFQHGWSHCSSLVAGRGRQWSCLLGPTKNTVIKPQFWSL